MSYNSLKARASAANASPMPLSQHHTKRQAVHHRICTLLYSGTTFPQVWINSLLLCSVSSLLAACKKPPWRPPNAFRARTSRIHPACGITFPYVYHYVFQCFSVLEDRERDTPLDSRLYSPQPRVPALARNDSHLENNHIVKPILSSGLLSRSLPNLF